MGNIIYIAGPMRGYEDYNRSSFNEAEIKLRKLGYLVINPAIMPTDLPETCYLPICMAMIDQCDSIYMLTDSEKSYGARIEYFYARQSNKKILSEVIDTIGELERIYHADIN